jgi:hypothetical protein
VKRVVLTMLVSVTGFLAMVSFGTTTQLERDTAQAPDASPRGDLVALDAATQAGQGVPNSQGKER